MICNLHCVSSGKIQLVTVVTIQRYLSDQQNVANQVVLGIIFEAGATGNQDLSDDFDPDQPWPDLRSPIKNGIQRAILA